MKTRVRGRLDKGESFEEIRTVFSLISVEDLQILKETSELPHSIEHRVWGKIMQQKNVGSHNLGSRGYVGQEPKWKAQDAQWKEQGVDNPFDQFPEGQEHAYIRSRYGKDPKTGTLVTDPKVKELKVELVSILPA